MPDEIPPTVSDRLIVEFTAMRQSIEGLKSTMEQRFEEALRPIERALRMVSLIPLALIFATLTTFLFYVGKITENTWFWMNIFLLAPFFGEAARVVLDKIPMTRPAAALLGKASIIVFAIACLSMAFSGCAGSANPASQAWGFYNENYDRSLSVSTTTDGKPMVSYTISPKAKPIAAATPSAFTQDQVAELMAHFAQYAIKDGKAVIPPVK